MSSVGFEPTPPKRMAPKATALDHSAKTTSIILASAYVVFCTSLFIRNECECDSHFLLLILHALVVRAHT